MKIGINLVGIASDVNGKDSMGYSGTSKERDWQLGKDYILSKVINCWEEHDVKTYLFSYENYDTNDIVEFYKPKKYKFIPFEGSHQQLTFLQSLENLLDEDLDIIISTRFDINFKQNLSKYNIDFDKSNFLFRESDGWWPIHKFTCDNLFVIPKKHLTSWIQSVKNLRENPPRPNPDLHGLCKYLIELIGEENINFLVDGYWRSSNSPTPWEEPYNTEYRLLRKPDTNHEPYDLNTNWKNNI